MNPYPGWSSRSWLPRVKSSPIETAEFLAAKYAQAPGKAASGSSSTSIKLGFLSSSSLLWISRPPMNVRLLALICLVLTALGFISLANGYHTESTRRLVSAPAVWDCGNRQLASPPPIYLLSHEIALEPELLEDELEKFRLGLMGESISIWRNVKHVHRNGSASAFPVDGLIIFKNWMRC